MNVSGIQKTFEDLVKYHNTMLVEKTKFIAADLPELVKKLTEKEKEMSHLLRKEEELTKK